MKEAIKRELQVAFSRKSQPIWFRITKWVILIGGIAILFNTKFIWWWIIGAVFLGIVVHFIWRWKTKNWTQPWGGWNDLETGQNKK